MKKFPIMQRGSKSGVARATEATASLAPLIVKQNGSHFVLCIYFGVHYFVCFGIFLFNYVSIHKNIEFFFCIENTHIIIVL